MAKRLRLDEKKIELLKLARQELREDITMRREWEFRTLTWFTAGLLAAIGFIVSADPKGLNLSGLHPNPMRIFLAAVVTVVVLLVLKYIWRNRQSHDEAARAVVKISELFHYWEEGYFWEKGYLLETGHFTEEEDASLYPPQWRGWGKSWESHWGTRSVILILVILGLVVVAALLFSA